MPFSPDTKQGTWRNFCTQEGLTGPCSVSLSPLHHTHVDAHTNTHLYTCVHALTSMYAGTHTSTQIHIHVHSCPHTHRSMCVCSHTCTPAGTQIPAHACVHTQPWGRASPRLFGRPSTTWAGPVTPAASAFLLQDLLLVAATCLCIPCVCVCPTGEPCVWGCVPHRRMSRRLRQQGREDHQLCRGFTSSPQAGSRHTVAGGQERLECLQNLQHGRLGVLAGIYTEVLGARSRLLMHPQPHGDSAVCLALGSKG